MYFVPDEAKPAELIATYRDWSAPGSYLLICHATDELHPSEQTEEIQNPYKKATSTMNFRGHDEVESFFAGYELVEPGVSLLALWHPEEEISAKDAERTPGWAALREAGEPLAVSRSSPLWPSGWPW